MVCRCGLTHESGTYCTGGGPPRKPGAKLPKHDREMIEGLLRLAIHQRTKRMGLKKLWALAESLDGELTMARRVLGKDRP